MRRLIFLSIATLFMAVIVKAQNFDSRSDDGVTMSDDGRMFNPHGAKDTLNQHKEVPKGMYVWTVDSRFGDRRSAVRDTLQHLFMNSIFTTGRYGEYSTTGNLGAPRMNRIFVDRGKISDFFFVNAFDYFLRSPEQVRFTNTLSPITNLAYNSCGDKTDGEDHLTASFAVNAGKRLGVGMKFDYLYGLGYYSNQSTSLFDWSFWTSYLGERYQAHFIFSTDRIKLAENGGITNDDYVTHPELFRESFSSLEIPTVLSDNWNQIGRLHGFLSHRYNVGFYKKVPMTEQEIEARRFAIQVEKEREEKERQKGNKGGNTKANTESFAGRPDDAKVVGDLPSDTVKTVASERIAVDEALADSLLKAENVVKADTSWMKNEYVPVTSFIHTLQIDNYHRVYHAHSTPNNYYNKLFATLDETRDGYIKDIADNFSMRNTLAVGLLEGFNKWAKSGMKLFAANTFDNYSLPDTVSNSKSYTETTVYLGAQLTKEQGRLFHYNATAEFGAVGENIGDLKVDFSGDVNIPLLGDTTSLLVNGFFHTEHPAFLMRHYHSRHYWWDNNDLDKQIHSHVEGALNIKRTKTSLRIAYDNIENYTYLATSYNRAENSGMISNHTIAVRQSDKNISLLTAELCQDFRVGKLNWENRATYQYCVENDILPVPQFNLWTNLYLDFKIARVLSCHLGAEATYFTKYAAPEYVAQLASYAVQENVDVKTNVGNYPFVSAYANFVLKGCRFFVMMSHINAGQGTRNYFTVPHHPMNERVFRLGISWNFFN